MPLFVKKKNEIKKLKRNFLLCKKEILMQLEAFKKLIERQDIPLFDAKLLKKSKGSIQALSNYIPIFLWVNLKF